MGGVAFGCVLAEKACNLTFVKTVKAKRMALNLGVDTGGTYTDAVIVRDETDVIASAKALTTRHDLAVGIGEAIRSVLRSADIDPREIGLASLSTTLATNALVENQGGRVALIFIGFRERDLDTHGLRDALKGDPCLVIEGGHNHAGSEAHPLNETAISGFLETYKDQVTGFAVAAQFAVRNPAHELRVLEMIATQTECPASASHQLSAKLGGPKRALTALLNARLIGMIDRLISRAQNVLESTGIVAPMMVVRGDGALISADQARGRPIETILSGPAASIVGARWMTGAQQALVSDIGGTTTDVALLTDGRPSIDPRGARVGPYRTMVEAVAMRTSGLGGDSEVHFVSEGLQGGVTLGPRRLVPVSLVAMQHPTVVHEILDQQLRLSTPGEYDAKFVRAVPGMPTEGLSDRDDQLLSRIGTDIQPLSAVLKTRMEAASLKRLAERGLVQIAGVTPSDASHVLGRTDAWDSAAARKALELFGRRRTGAGERMGVSAAQVADTIINRVTHQTGLVLLESAFAEDTYDFGSDPITLAQNPIVQSGLSDHRGIVRVSAGLNIPIVGLGASAPTYYPAVGKLLGTPVILPEHAGVANAIGAVVGRIMMRESGTVTAPSEGRFRIHLSTGPEDFSDADTAMSHLETYLTRQAKEAAHLAGAEDVTVSTQREIRSAQTEGRDIFVEADISVEASGRPRVAAG